MEQPPGSLDDLQPQDLSTSTVIDLTGSGEECVLNPASLEALRLVKSPGWYPSTGTGDPTLPFIETGSSDITLQPGDQVQPDNAFSRTTVTLSYVSRSHVFSAQDSIYSVTPVSLLPLHTDLDKGLVETGAYALNQHYVEEAQGPVDLATRMELFQALSGAQMGPDYHGGVCLTQAANGGVILSEGDIVTHVEMEAEQSFSMENSSSVFENGQGDSWSSSVVVETLSPTIMEEERVDFPVIHKPDPLLDLDSLVARDPPSPDKEYLSPLEEPVSPSAPSPDNVEDVFILPQACSSPSADTVHLETANEVAWNASSTAGAIQLSSDITDGTTRSDSSCENKRPVRRRKALLEPLIDLTDDDCVSEVSQIKPKPVVAHMNGNAKESERTLKVKKLPMRLGRGTRLEAIVMNINSGRYKFSGCIRTNKKANTPKSKASDSKLASLKPNDAPPVVAQKKGKVKASPSVKSVKQKAASPTKRAQTNNNNTDSCKDSTSDIEINHSKKTHNGTTSPKSPRSAVHKNSKDSVEIHAKSPPPPPPIPPPQSPKKSPGKGKALGSKTSPTAKSKGASTPKTKGASTPKTKGASTPKTTGASTPKTTGASTPKTTGASTPKTKGASTPKTKGASTPKTTGASTPKTRGASTPKTTGASTPKPKRRRKKISITSQPLSSMFSPKEPEIRLRYLQHKEEKRELRIDAFSPFIHVERKQTSPSLCSVVNYPQEVRTPHKKLTQPGGGFISATVPTTSCLQLGRPSSHSQQQGPLVCCLCGRATNTMDLGDLHGPYYPEGFRPSTKTAASTSGLKEDDNGYSDSDSSACSVRGRGRRKRAVPRPLRPGGAQPQSQQWSLDGTGSPSAKRARSDAGTADVEDWYSPPVLPLEPCEYWLHEDCAVWSAGVFLVKGRVYGLEEAVKAAQETTCSACQNPGASLGCFFKGCPNKYHYRCALESDCVLIEENFSMRCKKHKNKTFKSPPGNRWKDR